MDHHGTLKTATFSPLFPSNVPRAHWNGHDFASLLGFHLSLCCMTLWQQLNINEAYPAWVKFLWKQKRKEYYTHKSSLLCVFCNYVLKSKASCSKPLAYKWIPLASTETLCPLFRYQCSDLNLLDGVEQQRIGFKGIITIPKPIQFKSSVKEYCQVKSKHTVSNPMKCWNHPSWRRDFECL